MPTITPLTAAILSIGTEVTSGQIANSNAQRLSQDLESLDFIVRRHVAVDDHVQRIQDALTFAAAGADVVVVTGGLGPTSDDVTRNAVAEWLQVPLEFNTASWQKIEETFARMKRPIHEIQRHQAYFPKGARVFFNPRGTADAFAVSRDDLTLYVLPGPPREIEALWIQNVEPELRARRPENSRSLRMYRCRGKGESEFALLAEAALAGSGLEIGYRLDEPFIEVKVWVPSAKEAHAAPYLQALTLALKPYLRETRVRL